MNDCINAMNNTTAAVKRKNKKPPKTANIGAITKAGIIQQPPCSSNFFSSSICFIWDRS